MNIRGGYVSILVANIRMSPNVIVHSSSEIKSYKCFNVCTLVFKPITLIILTRFFSIHLLSSVRM